MAIDWKPTASPIVVALGASLVGAVGAGSQAIIGVGDYWVITNSDWGRYAAAYGDPQWVNLEDLLAGNAPLSGAIRTRGLLHAGPRPEGQGVRQYALVLPADRLTATMSRSQSIQPGVIIRKEFEAEADTLNLREIELVGTFEAAVGRDRGGPTGFWFWAYATGPSGRPGRSSARGLLAIADLIGRPERPTGETIKVRGQFRGRNLFRDLETAGAPTDGWVIKDGPVAVWVVGRSPRGDGWRLDLDNRGDTTKWVEVTGKLERKGGVTRIKAGEVALVPPPVRADP